METDTYTNFIANIQQLISGIIMLIAYGVITKITSENDGVRMYIMFYIMTNAIKAIMHLGKYCMEKFSAK